jgi:uncharacterized protein (DUF2235 family)
MMDETGLAAPLARAAAAADVIDRPGPSAASRNLVVCCDGTGNVWQPGPDKTNVVKLFESLIRDEHQLAYYDPGVGTPDGTLSGDGLRVRDTLARLGGLAWGDGVWNNVAEAYTFLLRNYRPGDRIFLTGFSRGAFTARAVSGLVHMFGLVRPEHENMIPTLLRVYRSKNSVTRTQTAASLKLQFARGDVPIHFIGCWDTVESVGIWEFLGAKITSDRNVKPNFHHIRHALALDELRWPFKPREYIAPDALPADRSRTFSQVWFRGAHSDIGGGYNEAGLANITLHWMAREAYEQGLAIKLADLEQYQTDPFDVLHDPVSRMPAWILAGVFGRRLPAAIEMHESVLARAENERDPVFRVPDDAVPAATLRAVCRANGSEEILPPLPVAAVNATPRRQALPRWLIPLWLLSGVATALLFAASLGAGTDLAFAYQLGWKRPLFAGLGQALAAWQESSRTNVAGLLRADLALIASFSVFFTLLLFLLFRWHSRWKYPGELLGKAACFSGLALPLADLVEDWFTFKALDAYLRQNSGRSGLSWIPYAWLDHVYSIGTTLASLAKFVSLGILLAVVLYCALVGVAGSLARSR